MSAKTYKKSIDWWTIIVFAVIAIFGWVNVYSASYNPENPSIFAFDEVYGRTFFWICVSAVLGFVILNLEGRLFSNFALPYYAFWLLLLAAVLIVGKEVGGAKAWFGIGSFGIQPAEFSKTATALFLAKYLSSSVKLADFDVKVKALLILAVPLGLILLQPDVGTMLVFLAFIFPMYREGLPSSFLLIGFGSVIMGVVAIFSIYGEINYPFFGAASGIPLVFIIIISIALIFILGIKNFVVPRFRKKYQTRAIVIAAATIAFIGGISLTFDKVFQSHHKARIEILFGFNEDTQGAGYNVLWSKRAIGSGGLTGKGFLKGPVTQGSYVPEQHTDFIFCTVGEEWGFLGSAFLIILYFILITRLVTLAERQRSSFSRIYGYSVASILFMHLLINVGMVIGLAPVIGIPLSLFSYGGSSIMSFTIMVFIMLRLDTERMQVLG